MENRHVLFGLLLDVLDQPRRRSHGNHQNTLCDRVKGSSVTHLLGPEVFGDRVNAVAAGNSSWFENIDQSEHNALACRAVRCLCWSGFGLKLVYCLI